MSPPPPLGVLASPPARTGGPRLPVAALVASLDAWAADPGDAARASVRAACEELLAVGGVPDGWLRLRVAPWPPLDLGLGALAAAVPPPDDTPDGTWLPLGTASGRAVLGTIWLPGPAAASEEARALLETTLDLAWSRTEARLAAERLDALDAATAAIAAELSVDRVLQVIVDRVRALVGAQYAALGINGDHGTIERFVTSGMDDASRRAIGHPPRGLGILGLIVRENASIRIADLTSDPRAVGFPPHHPPMRAFLGVPVAVEGRSIGNLYLTNKAEGHPFTADDQRLVEMFARHAGIAIHNARLHHELGRLAVLQERERIGQDLHDGIIQALYAVGLSLEDAGELMADDPVEAAARVERAIDSIHGTIRDIRNFIFGLRPELLDDVDLRGGLAILADEFRTSTLVDIELRAPEPVDLDAEDAVQLLQLTREALSNVARHADATRVVIDLGATHGSLRLAIADDGRGFDPAATRGPAHHGLTNMRARAESMGGRLTITSRPGAGTRVVAELPIDADIAPEERTP